MSDACVFVVYREGGLEPATRAAVTTQWEHVQYRLTTVHDIYAYADTLRMLWPYPADWVICEQDVVPPLGSIPALLNCEAEWCTHRGWCRPRYQPDTLQLAKLSWSLRRRHPELADAALAGENPASWVRKGWTRLDPQANAATLNTYGRRATIRPDASGATLYQAGGRLSSTVNWVTVDSHLARQLYGAGYTPHVHEPPPRHLHDYDARPVNIAED